MFGTLRLVLAILVVAAHCELPHQINLGVSAVVVFFILSGYVMTASIQRYYHSWERYGAFLLDRTGRIFPQYLFWLGATATWLFFVPSSSVPLGWQALVENSTLLPLMFVVYDLKPIISGTVYVSQAWSLSLEWYFYMILPTVLLIPNARKWAFAGSFIVATLAALHVISPYNYGYHLLPGVLFIFLIGSFIFEEANAPAPPRRTTTALALVAILAVASNATTTMGYEWTKEVITGVLAGVPLVYLLARFPTNRVDDMMGNLSYGVFLCHYLVLAAIYKTHLLQSHWAIFTWAVSGSLPLAMLSYYLVEKPFLRLRRARRSRYQAARNAA